MTREEIEKRMDKHLKPLVLYHQDSTSCLSGSYNTLHKDKWPRPQNHVPTLLHTPHSDATGLYTVETRSLALLKTVVSNHS